MKYRITERFGKETGHTLGFVVEHRKFWTPLFSLWEPVRMADPDGLYCSYADALAAIGRHMVVRGGVRTRKEAV